MNVFPILTNCRRPNLPYQYVKDNRKKFIKKPAFGQLSLHSLNSFSFQNKKSKLLVLIKQQINYYKFIHSIFNLFVKFVPHNPLKNASSFLAVCLFSACRHFPYGIAVAIRQWRRWAIGVSNGWTKVKSWKWGYFLGWWILSQQLFINSPHFSIHSFSSHLRIKRGHKKHWKRSSSSSERKRYRGHPYGGYDDRHYSNHHGGHHGHGRKGVIGKMVDWLTGRRHYWAGMWCPRMEKRDWQWLMMCREGRKKITKSKVIFFDIFTMYIICIT